MLLSAMRQRDKHIGTWLSLGSPVIAELASLYSFNWLLFDLEHGCGTEATLLSNLQATRRNDIAMIVRPGQMDAALISKALDWGATGIMLPHVNTASQAKDCLSAMYYPPHGNRGYSSSARVYDYGTINSQAAEIPIPLFIAQIESEEGVKNADSIASVEGVDVLFLGPADLKWELASKGGIPTISFESALEKVVKAAVTHGKQAGITAKNANEVTTYLQMGFTYITYGSDLAFLKQGFQSVKEKFL